MVDQTSKAEANFSEVGDLQQTSLRVAQGLSPRGFGIVIGSYDGGYSGSGALHQYISHELELYNAEEKVIWSGDGYRLLSFLLPSSKNHVLLGQVVSIYGGPDNARNLQTNLIELLRRLNENFKVQIPPIIRQPTTMWIPTLGTGSAGLSHLKSAQLIASALSSGLNFPQGATNFTEITIAPSDEIKDEEYQEIVAVFSSNASAKPKDTTTDSTQSEPLEDEPDPSIDEPETVSAMPDHFHSDHALTDAAHDDLGRDAIAETIATNVTRVWADQKRQKRPFAIHLSGRWGSGKSSILGFLGKKLSQDTTHHPKGWIVVDYNAWRMQEAGPPWWSLLTTVREQGYVALGSSGYWPRFTDWLWRNTRTFWPWITTLLVIILFVVVFQFLSTDGSATQTITITTNETLVDTSQITSVKETVWPVERPNNFVASGSAWTFVLAIITGLGSVGALAKLIQGWSRSASESAEAVRELQSDPTATVKARFEGVISNIDRPVVVFIDDLDRCDARFVVELMQSLQTAYSNTAVLYVVASDRDWIVSAYNQIYDGFLHDLSKPGAPLGYLFVKKIFQLSVPVPDLARSDRTRLVRALLNTEANIADETATREERAIEIRDAASEGDLSRVTEIQFAALAEGQNLASEVMRAVSDPENQKRLRHKLLDYADEFDGNPRSIKRLINALTFRQGYILTAGEEIPFDQIARWTILSLRFPYTADLLAARPTTKLPDNPTDEFPDPEMIKSILGSLTPSDIERVASFG